MNSLQSRLHLGLSGTLLILMVLMWWLVSSGLGHISEQIIQSRLEHDAEALLASLQVNQANEVEVKESLLGHIYQRVFSGHYFTIQVDGETIRSRSLWDQTLDQPMMAVGESMQIHTQGPDNQFLLLWSAGYQRFDRNITVTMAEDITQLYSHLRTFNIFFAFSAVVILLVLMFVQRWVVRGSFQSVKAVADDLEKLAEGQIANLPEQVPEEIRPLVNEVNRLLQLLNQRLQRSRNSMGNLAHSLKHPLNLLMQLAHQEELAKYPTISEELSNNTQQIFQLMERELRRARLAGAGMPGQRFIAADDVPGLVDVLQRVYRDKDIVIDHTIESGLELAADRNDMLELLGNLLDNACKWSKTIVTLNIYRDNGVHIVVEDDGPGCDDELLSQLTQRGVRVDEEVSGSGLGLSIVKDIVQLYDGEINFSRSKQLGGLAVEVILS